MLKYIDYINEITLWWKRTENMPLSATFCLYLDGTRIGDTKKTFYRLSGLQADTEYTVALYTGDGDAKVLLDEIRVTTRAEKKIVDFTKLSYYKNDGVITKQLQRALDELKESEILYFPKGEYVTGALDIHSNSELYLDDGAILHGTDNLDDYLPKIKSRFEGIEMECYRSLLNIGRLNHKDDYTTKNVVIRGKGTIAGGGKTLALNTIEKERELLKEFMQANPELVDSCETVDTIPARRRGRLINMSNCQNVVLSGLELKNGPAWNVHFIYSKDIITENCRFFSDGVWNGDGWDPDSSTDCAIFDCFFNTGDDCVAIKSGKNPEGNIINRPTKNIYVFSCSGVSGHGIAIGSEMSGGIENVYVWDCDFEKSCYGVQIKSSEKRGGYLKNIHFNNCSFPCILIVSVDYNNDGESANVLPTFDGFYFEDLRLTGISVMRERRRKCCAIDLSGINERARLQNVYLKNIQIQDSDKEIDEEIKLKLIKSISIENVTITR